MSEEITLKSGEVINLADYPLPEGVQDDLLNQRDLAKAFNVSAPTLSKYLDAGMPVAKEGGHGVDYALQLSHCYAWRMWSRDQEATARKARDANLNQLALSFLGDDTTNPEDAAVLSPKKIREFSEALLIRNKAAEQQGDLLRRGDMERMVEDMIIAFRNSLATLPDWMEQEFSLSPQQVEKAERHCDAVLEASRHAVSKAGLRAVDVVSIGAEQVGNRA